jgi:hypothetical protein
MCTRFGMSVGQTREPQETERTFRRLPRKTGAPATALGSRSGPHPLGRNCGVNRGQEFVIGGYTAGGATFDAPRVPSRICPTRSPDGEGDLYRRGRGRVHARS